MVDTPIRPALLGDNEFRFKVRLKNEFRRSHFWFTPYNVEVLYRCQWGISKEIYLLIKAGQAFTLLASLLVTSISYGKDFVVHFSKVVFLVQTYCCVSSISLNIVQELKLSKSRLIQNRKQRLQLKILREDLYALKIGSRQSVHDQQQLAKSYSERTVIKRESGRESFIYESFDEEEGVPLGSWGRRFLKFEWFLRNICNDYAFTVTFMYYVKSEVLMMELSHLEKLTDVCNSVQILIDLIFSALPVRLFHIVYSYLFGLFFLAYSYLMHAYFFRPKVPPMETDWDNLNVKYLLGIFLAGVLVCHLVTFIITFVRVSSYIVYYKHKYKIKFPHETEEGKAEPGGGEERGHQEGQEQEEKEKKGKKEKKKDKKDKKKEEGGETDEEEKGTTKV